MVIPILTTYWILFHADNDAPVLTTTDMSPVEGVNVTLTCTAITTDVIQSYTWYKNNVKIANAAATTYLLPNKNRTDDGKYSCSVTTAALGPSVNSSSITIGFKCKSLFDPEYFGIENLNDEINFCPWFGNSTELEFELVKL